MQQLRGEGSAKTNEFRSQLVLAVKMLHEGHAARAETDSVGLLLAPNRDPITSHGLLCAKVVP
jgi:hypothetical protein